MSKILKSIVTRKFVYGGMLVDKYFFDIKEERYAVQVSQRMYDEISIGSCMNCGLPEKDCTCPSR